MSQADPPPAPASEGPGLAARIVEVFLRGRLAVLFVVVALLGGAYALLVTPREEDPQIVVPVADVLISAPGASAEEIDRQVAARLEKLLYEIDGVEDVYSMSRAGQAIVTVRFFVGEDRERSLVKLSTKLANNLDRVPAQVTGWVVRPVEIDDVPVWAAAIYGPLPDDQLRRIAEELERELKAVHDTGRTEVVGGAPWKLHVRVDPHAAAAYGVSWAGLARALAAANVRVPAGTLDEAGRSVVIEAGSPLRGPDDLAGLVVAVQDGRPVYLRDLARIELGPDEPTSYCRIAFGPAAAAAPGGPPPAAGPEGDLPAITIAVSKRKGANAVTVAQALGARLDELARELLPEGVEARVVRDYGRTADDKVHELLEALWVAIAIVIGLIALTLGWREGLVVAAAVPITFALTLLVNHLAGYTINRVTLFALILALGLVVDDPIVDVENIHRHLRTRKVSRFRAVLDAVNEVRPPIILATLAVIVSFLPLFFITGMMGPYMRPMALNVPLAMLMSLVVAFTVTPWMSLKALHGGAREEGEAGEGADPSAPTPPAAAGTADDEAIAITGTRLFRVYGALLRPLLRRRALRWGLVAFTAFLFLGSGWLAAERRVPLKMLPFDNKAELLILVDTEEGTTLEATEAAAAALSAALCQEPEVTEVLSYAGVAAPVDFNGLVRHYNLRQGPNVADLRVNLVHKRERVHQSHDLALRVRPALEEIAARHGALVRIVELPPGPPVLSTLVAEVYGAMHAPYEDLMQGAEVVAERLRREPGVVDVDTTVEAARPRARFLPDGEKARLTGVSEAELAAAIAAAQGGLTATFAHMPTEVSPPAIELRLEPEQRTRVDALSEVFVLTPLGGAVPAGELGRWERSADDATIYRKNLRRVVYVTAELAGRAPAEVIQDVLHDLDAAPAPGGRVADGAPRAVEGRSYLAPGGGLPWALPPAVELSWNGEGEWKITLDVFRDLGLAFLAACVGIYVLLVYETESYLVPLVLMLSIPLTVIGILPGFWLLNALGGAPVAGYANPIFFTATAMIGMIALAGIAVRNAILLIEFVERARASSGSLEEALVRSGAVRIRPIFLTAGTAMLAAWPITLDPIFSGLAWALIFGLTVSTAFTLLVIPVAYAALIGERADTAA